MASINEIHLQNQRYKTEYINRCGTHGGLTNGIHHTGGIFHRGGKAIRTHFDRAKRPEKSQL